MTHLTHRRTNDKNPAYTNFVVLFAECESFSDDSAPNYHYGPHIWKLQTELPDVLSCDLVIEFACEFYGIDREEAEEVLNPDDIVSSAGAWDDTSFVSALCQEIWDFNRIPEVAGFRTWDGAVVIDPHSVKMTYHVE